MPCELKLVWMENASMRVVTAFIKHFRVQEVCQALSKLDITGITITEVKGFGRPRGAEFFPGAEPMMNFLPRIRLEVAVPSELVEKTVAAIKGAVRTGQIGDGKIFVTHASLAQSAIMKATKSGERPHAAAGICHGAW
jgi:nitrogen regulatory protein P-II 2